MTGQMNNNGAARQSARAFTLLEVMAALAILSIALLVLVRGQTESLNNVHRVQTYERGLFIAENSLHWTMIDLNEAKDWRELSTLSGEDGMYRWQVEMMPAEMDHSNETRMVMLHIKSIITWPEGRGEGLIELETYYLWGQEQ